MPNWKLNAYYMPVEGRQMGTSATPIAVVIVGHRRVFIVYAALGETDRAFRWLEKAYVDRDDWLISVKVGPWPDRLRGDWRFAGLLRRVHP